MNVITQYDSLFLKRKVMMVLQPFYLLLIYTSKAAVQLRVFMSFLNSKLNNWKNLCVIKNICHPLRVVSKIARGKHRKKGRSALLQPMMHIATKNVSRCKGSTLTLTLFCHNVQTNPNHLCISYKLEAALKCCYSTYLFLLTFVTKLTSVTYLYI